MKKKSLKTKKSEGKKAPSKTKKPGIRPEGKASPGLSVRTNRPVTLSGPVTFRKSELLRNLAELISRLDESRLEHLVEHTHILLHNMKTEETAKKQAMDAGAPHLIK
jgi:hypothetical protein